MSKLVLVMGVSGCGKSTVGQGIAQALGLRYIEGDAYHPLRNVERMRASIALNDDDRAGWLQALADELAKSKDTGAVLACSALKRKYRETLRDGAKRAGRQLQTVVLHGDPSVLAARMGERQGHYMPASLLASQLNTLELPQSDECAVVLNLAEPVPDLIKQALLYVRQHDLTDQSTTNTP
jgi:gluconokinase